ncbi:uncharacterized protein TNCV_3510961 [Trichonephila clavipes]|nr:uncharacterized protein TNCV_3510961 [Trichonephila clavipes]
MIKCLRWHLRARTSPLLTRQLRVRYLNHLGYHNHLKIFVRNRCLHLATGRTRDAIEGRIWQRQRRRVSDEWSRDLKSLQVRKQRSCRGKRELLEVITAERLETEQQQKLEQQEHLSTEKLRLEIELTRNANQSATQNNGQTSRVNSLDEIVKMVRLLTVKVPNKSDGWDYFFSSLEKAFASEMVSDELKPKVLLCMLGDKVSNLLVNLDEEELKDYESLKQVVLKEWEIIPHALLDSGTEINVIKKDLVPGISVEGASTIYLKGIFGPAVKCPLVYVPIGLATGGQVNVVHQQVLCALAEVLVEDVLLPPEVLDMLGGAQSEENSLAQSSQDLRVDSGNEDETEVSLGILPEKVQEHIEDSQRNITSCRNEVGTLGTKNEEVTAEMDKGIMVADSFRSEQECCAELALVWKQAKEGKGNYYGVDGHLFHRDKILGESIGQLGLRADVKKFCESCKECQLTQSVGTKDRSHITPVARSELPFQVVNMDLIGPIDPPSSKGHTYIYVWLISTLGGACKEPLPAPGNRSNERRYRGKDLATTEEKSECNHFKKVQSSSILSFHNMTQEPNKLRTPGLPNIRQGIIADKIG